MVEKYLPVRANNANRYLMRNGHGEDDSASNESLSDREEEEDTDSDAILNASTPSDDTLDERFEGYSDQFSDTASPYHLDETDLMELENGMPF